MASAEARERRVRRRIYITYGLLFFNTLTFYTGISILHIPSTVGKGVAQAALPVALLMALSLNHKVILRPNVFLCLVSLLVLGALITSLQPQHFGTVLRTFRFAEFVAWALAADTMVGQAGPIACPVPPHLSRDSPRIGASRSAR